ncbi:MAG: DUF5320 domain-containing protein [Bacteroidales bacterium]|nr:DUF5320 domain-containing protein [Bacteroidales bacterium]
MPRGDRTGPNGAGAMSGRRMGFCVGNKVPAYQNFDHTFYGGQGYGYRHGFNRGTYRGYGRFGFRYERDFYPSEPVDKKIRLEEQIESLKNQLTFLEDQYKNLS